MYATTLCFVGDSSMSGFSFFNSILLYSAKLAIVHKKVN
jgi:hypothetical protein